MATDGECRLRMVAGEDEGRGSLGFFDLLADLPDRVNGDELRRLHVALVGESFASKVERALAALGVSWDAHAERLTAAIQRIPSVHHAVTPDEWDIAVWGLVVGSATALVGPMHDS